MKVLIEELNQLLSHSTPLNGVPNGTPVAEAPYDPDDKVDLGSKALRSEGPPITEAQCNARLSSIVLKIACMCMAICMTTSKLELRSSWHPCLPVSRWC